MLGLMQDWPLLVHKIIDHAALRWRLPDEEEARDADNA